MSPNLQLPYLTAGQNGAEFTVNDALNILDALVLGAVVTRGLTTPPPTPAEGQMFLIGTNATGVWVGHDEELALWYSGWRFVPAREGLKVWVNDEDALLVYNGTTWVTR